MSSRAFRIINKANQVLIYVLVIMATLLCLAAFPHLQSFFAALFFGAFMAVVAILLRKVYDTVMYRSMTQDTKNED